jgi:MoaA/NifB/PqqE/SkfB family radical SAM enzyme
LVALDARRLAREDRTVTTPLHRAIDYVRFGLDFFVLHSDKPQILGLVTNDTCNLHCLGCRVANVSNAVMSMQMIRETLERYYDKGVRMVYLSGGEPYMWRDGPYRMPDIVDLAHDIGYLRVHVYTNGTARLSTAPDFTWISIDGFGKTFEKLRGIPVERVLRNARRFAGKHAVVCTINTENYREIPQTLAFLNRELPGTGVMFFFHTPYYGIDYLYLSQSQREQAVDAILCGKKSGMPVLNSRAALRAYLDQSYGPPMCHSWIVDNAGEYRCCRVEGDPEICKDCGYSTGYEILLAQRWHPASVHALMRTH